MTFGPSVTAASGWRNTVRVREGLIGDPTAGECFPQALYAAGICAEAAALNGRPERDCPWDPDDEDVRERVLAKTWILRHRRAVEAIAGCRVCRDCGGTCAWTIVHVNNWHKGYRCTWCGGRPE